MSGIVYTMTLIERQREHWKKIHTTIMSQKEFEAWCDEIPWDNTCKCKMHLWRILERLPPRYDDWDRYTWELHNAVNKKIGKPEFEWKSACELWGWDFAVPG